MLISLKGPMQASHEYSPRLLLFLNKYSANSKVYTFISPVHSLHSDPYYTFIQITLSHGWQFLNLDFITLKKETLPAYMSYQR